MILVTGATGNIGTPLLSQLHRHGARPLRGLTRDAGRAATAFPAGVEAVAADLARTDSLKPALDGVRALFLVSRLGDDAAILAAAREAGVEHVVLVSSVTVETHPHLPAAVDNATTERLLKDSGMAWTILRPTQFTSNTLWWAPAIRAHQPVRVPYADIGLPAVHPSDIASVARLALTEPGHQGQTYALTGPARITPREQAAAIGAALGRDVPLAEISRAEAHTGMAAFLGAEQADAVLDLMGGDVNDALRAVRDTVPRLTGAPALPFHRWATEHADAFRP
ncbi:NAD(P)H-binding protein [Streptomyces paludis]|uniref:NAD-dependent epimerase/dehydratase family protein n=1 Tax=Streptomyces paludis TaxID=2282738 RepID=A0A345HRK6_9ACTN|nr:NAD(P)H-binding protein [Streptomyces paludis]AXG79330.1 NAD-dependent epimerase/dehydratase family protein [Streptomyces paludis]